jgi:hypothetical protein
MSFNTNERLEQVEALIPHFPNDRSLTSKQLKKILNIRYDILFTKTWLCKQGYLDHSSRDIYYISPMIYEAYYILKKRLEKIMENIDIHLGCKAYPNCIDWMEGCDHPEDFSEMYCN